VGATSRRRPPRADPRTPERPWIPVDDLIRDVPADPYLVSLARSAEIRTGLASRGFVVVEVTVDALRGDVERSLVRLCELVRAKPHRKLVFIGD